VPSVLSYPFHKLRSSVYPITVSQSVRLDHQLVKLVAPTQCSLMCAGGPSSILGAEKLDSILSTPPIASKMGSNLDEAG